MSDGVEEGSLSPELERGGTFAFRGIPLVNNKVRGVFKLDCLELKIIG